MKTNLTLPSLLVVMAIVFSCTKPAQEVPDTAEVVQAGQSAVQDDDSQKNIVQTAIGSPDHKTLVAALKAAEYVNALSNAGPFTVFIYHAPRPAQVHHRRQHPAACVTGA